MNRRIGIDTFRRDTLGFGDYLPSKRFRAEQSVDGDVEY
jgi:hypothetical protein